MLFLVHPDTYASTVSLEMSNNSKNVDKSSSSTLRGQEECTGVDIAFISLDMVEILAKEDKNGLHGEKKCRRAAKQEATTIFLFELPPFSSHFSGGSGVLSSQ